MGNVYFVLNWNLLIKYAVGPFYQQEENKKDIRSDKRFLFILFVLVRNLVQTCRLKSASVKINRQEMRKKLNEREYKPTNSERSVRESQPACPY